MIFADTYYYLALLSERDEGHQRAVNYCQRLQGQVVTTEWIIVELGNACRIASRRQPFIRLLDVMRSDPNLTIVEANRALLQSGIELYANRPDKLWSLTDCISFVVMQQQGVKEALTADRHFEQAGFVPLLVE